MGIPEKVMLARRRSAELLNEAKQYTGSIYRIAVLYRELSAVDTEINRGRFILGEMYYADYRAAAEHDEAACRAVCAKLQQAEKHRAELTRKLQSERAKRNGEVILSDSLQPKKTEHQE